MFEALADIEGQQRAAGFLVQSLSSGNVTHAYLLAGGSAQARQNLALGFGACIVGGQDDVQVQAALRKTHPDVHFYTPAGTGGYLIDQVRQLVHDAELSPVRAARKVYIVDDVQRMSGAAANAFLKTLEEPAQDVVCILLASNEASVLQTLRSRCEVIALEEESFQVVADEGVFEVMEQLCGGCSSVQVVDAAKLLVSSANEEALALAPDIDEFDEQVSADYLSKGALRTVEQQRKRDGSARQREVLQQKIAVIRTWLRDCMLVQQGAEGLVSYPQCSRSVLTCATSVPASNIIQALRATSAATTRISCNVTPQLAIEAMLFEIKEALCPQ